MPWPTHIISSSGISNKYLAGCRGISSLSTPVSLQLKSAARLPGLAALAALEVATAARLLGLALASLQEAGTLALG